MRQLSKLRREQLIFKLKKITMLLLVVNKQLEAIREELKNEKINCAN